jgi:carbonic anhydrase
MDEKFSMCGKGKMQTPINIVATNDINLTPLNIIVCLVSLMLVAARKTLSNFILDWVVFISFSLIIVT